MVLTTCLSYWPLIEQVTRALAECAEELGPGARWRAVDTLAELLDQGAETTTETNYDTTTEDEEEDEEEEEEDENTADEEIDDEEESGEEDDEDIDNADNQ